MILQSTSLFRLLVLSPCFTGGVYLRTVNFLSSLSHGVTRLSHFALVHGGQTQHPEKHTKNSDKFS